MRRVVTRDERWRARLARIWLPGTTGGLYSIGAGLVLTLGAFVVRARNAWEGRDTPGLEFMLGAGVALMGVQMWRGSRAGQFNAENGVVPVPAPEAPSVSTQGGL